MCWRPSGHGGSRNGLGGHGVHEAGGRRGQKRSSRLRGDLLLLHTKGDELRGWQFLFRDGLEISLNGEISRTPRFPLAEEDLMIFRQEERKDTGGNVEGRREHDAEVAGVHLVDFCVSNDTKEVTRERFQEGEVFDWKRVHEVIELVEKLNSCETVCIVDLDELNKVLAALVGENVEWEFAKVEFQKTGDGVDVKVLLLSEEVEIGLCRIISIVPAKTRDPTRNSPVLNFSFNE